VRPMRTTPIQAGAMACLAILAFLPALACGPLNQPPDTSGQQHQSADVIYTAGDAGIGFVYDAVGRLVGVITPTGEGAQYDYDKAGNITKICAARQLMSGRGRS
jgi:YD repeat-containing protein